jgi:hypothetical protein
VAHRVAGGQGGRDDRRAQHEADDDQGAAAATARDVAKAELEEHGAADGERRDHGEAGPQDQRECERQGARRDAEELMHGAPTS